MGLDMYLKGKRYLSELFRPGDAQIKEAVADLFPELKGLKSHFDDGIVSQIEIDVGYWRKANSIHKWFVDNVQDGRDECHPYYVGRDQLQELKEVCQRVLADHDLAGTLLPAQEGFFFGGTEYDEWYFKGLEHTIQVVDQCLALPNGWDFEYRSSW